MKFPDKKVMYLSAEVPALSATFVYNEIFQFERQVCPVEIASVHRPTMPASQEILDRLKNRVVYLYGRSLTDRLKSIVKTICYHPLRFAGALLTLIADMFAVGFFSRTALGLGYRFVYGALLAEELEQRNIHHLHAHFAHVPGDIAMYASLMTGIPFSITGHANDIYERGWLLKRKAERAKFFATISVFNQKNLVARKCPEEKLQVVRCGIDGDDFSYRPPQTAAGQSLKVGSLGRLVPKKGFQTLLEACTILSESNLDLALEIAGEGPLNKTLQDYARNHHLNRKIDFLGPLPHTQVSAWMSSLDVFVLACCEDENGDVDGIPVVLMEAMAIGVPVVTTNVSGLPELVEAEVSGLVFDQMDAAGLAQQLVRLAADPKLCEQLSRRAKQRIDEAFTIEANVERLGELIFDD